MVYRSWRCTETVPGWDLDYFYSKEWLDAQDKLDELELGKVLFTPSRVDLFRALHLCSFKDVVCVFIAQDPYPSSDYATGVAFSIPERLRVFPKTLHIIQKELVADTGQPMPIHGCLESWCKQGVLLWNAIPVYAPFKSLRTGENINYFSVYNPFWTLTQEIIERLSGKGKIIFVFLGRQAQRFANYVDPFNNKIIFTSHPSPRGQINAQDKFLGSRLFTNINANLNFYLKEPIDWTL